MSQLFYASLLGPYHNTDRRRTEELSPGPFSIYPLFLPSFYSQFPFYLLQKFLSKSLCSFSPFIWSTFSLCLFIFFYVCSLVLRYKRWWCTFLCKYVFGDNSTKAKWITKIMDPSFHSLPSCLINCPKLLRQVTNKKSEIEKRLKIGKIYSQLSVVNP